MMRGVVPSTLKPVAWVFVICLLGIAFDSLLLMDDTTRYWVLVALLVVVFVLGSAVALRSMTKW